MDQVRDLYIRIGRFRSMLIGRERERKKERKKERERERDMMFTIALARKIEHFRFKPS